MKSHFFAYLLRMKNIKRWGLMRNHIEENVKEHSLDVAYIAHGIALIGNVYYHKNYNQEHIAVLAMFHDASEVITGDLATPIKYFNLAIKKAYKEIEHTASEKLAAMLPEELQDHYKGLILEKAASEEELRIVKAADKISAYFKCVEELKSGNHEFLMAQKALLDQIHELALPEAEAFMDMFAESVGLTLDELH